MDAFVDSMLESRYPTASLGSIIYRAGTRINVAEFGGAVYNHADGRIAQPTDNHVMLEAGGIYTVEMDNSQTVLESRERWANADEVASPIVTIVT